MNNGNTEPLVVVTGATGFIGRHMIAALSQRGYAVRALARPGATIAARQNVEVREIGDLTQTDWHAVLNGADAVVHLAAVAHRAAPRDSTLANRVRAVNVSAVAELTSAAVITGVRRLILLSSIGVLGAESGVSALGGSSPVAPHDFYSMTKLEAERVAADAIAKSTLELCIVRPPLVFGPDAPGNFGRMIKWVDKGLPLPLGAIHNQRSLISVWNLCDFLITCLTSAGAVGAPLVVADEQTISTSELLRICAHLLGRPERLIPVPLPLVRLVGFILGRRSDVDRLCGSLVVDTRDTYARTSWRAPLPLDEGLRRALTQSTPR